MIIWGTTTLESQLGRGTFACPRCGPARAYKHKGARRYFTLYFIPLIPLGSRGEYVECESCGATFGAEVLHAAGATGTSPFSTSGSIKPPLVAGQLAEPSFAMSSDPSAEPAQLVHSGPGSVSAMAISSLILAVISPCLCTFAILPALASVILGHVALLRIGGSMGAVTGRGVAIAGLVVGYLMTVFHALFLALLLIDIGDDEPEYALDDTLSIVADAQSAAESLREAERRILSDSLGDVHGNTEEARELASQFATRMQVLREALFTEASSGISLTDGKFITYCRLSDDRCVFLVHVPQYRNFASDAKDTLAELAWSTARSTIGEQLDETDRLAVGMKGVMLYGAIMVGTVADETPEYTGTDREYLYTFFDPVTASEPQLVLDEQADGDVAASQPDAPETQAGASGSAPAASQVQPPASARAPPVALPPRTVIVEPAELPDYFPGRPLGPDDTLEPGAALQAFVFGTWKEVVVEELLDDGTVRVRQPPVFPLIVARHQLRYAGNEGPPPAAGELAPGMHVKARRLDTWYAAEVLSVDRNLVTVRLAGEQRERRLPLQWVRVPPGSDRGSAPAGSGTSSPASGEPRPVTDQTPLAVGDKLLANWGNRWHEVEVLEVLDDGSVKIHWVGWSDNWDEVVPRLKLRLPPEGATRPGEDGSPSAPPPAESPGGDSGAAGSADE